MEPRRCSRKELENFEQGLWAAQYKQLADERIAMFTGTLIDPFVISNNGIPSMMLADMRYMLAMGDNCFLLVSKFVCVFLPTRQTNIRDILGHTLIVAKQDGNLRAYNKDTVSYCLLRFDTIDESLIFTAELPK